MALISGNRSWLRPAIVVVLALVLALVVISRVQAHKCSSWKARVAGLEVSFRDAYPDLDGSQRWLIAKGSLVWAKPNFCRVLPHK